LQINLNRYEGMFLKKELFCYFRAEKE
jgi:hypothetical protein